MFMSRHARRMQRRHARRARAEKLTLVSMVDILTALITFLLANSVAVHNPPMPKDLVLPQSIAEQPAKVQYQVTISRDQIMLGNTPVAATATVLASDKSTVPALAAALQQQPSQPSQPNAPATGQPTARGRGDITIVADKSLPYSLIKKVMQTCADAAFASISLVVLQHEGAS